MAEDQTQHDPPREQVPMLSYRSPTKRGANAVVWKITGMYMICGFVAVIFDSLLIAGILTQYFNGIRNFGLTFLVLAITGLIGWGGSSVVIWLVCWGHRRNFYLECTRRWNVKGAFPAAMGFILGWHGLMTVPMWFSGRGFPVTGVFVWLVINFAYLMVGSIIVGDWLWAKAVRENAWRAEAVLK